MNAIKILHYTATLGVASALSIGALAQSPVEFGDMDSQQLTQTLNSDMTEGEVRNIDTEARKITLKHGEIKNLEMPGMTMVFQVNDTALLNVVKSGDKVRFRAINDNGKLVITDIQPTT